VSGAEIIRREGDKVVHQNFTTVFSDKRDSDEGELIRYQFMKRHRADEMKDQFNGVDPDGRVLDHHTIQYTVTKREVTEFPGETILHVEASAVRRVPTRNDPITVSLDTTAYKSGATFRGADDGLYVNSGSVLMRLFTDWDSIREGRECMPLRVLWEPEYHMTVEEVYNADYGLEDGIPARWHVQQTVHASVRGGAL
jgi:hypothetical protein